MIIITELQTLLANAFAAAKNCDDAALQTLRDRIVELLVAEFAPEMAKFAQRLAHGYNPDDLIQDAWVNFIERKKFAMFDPEKAGNSGYVGWYRKVYRRSMLDAHRTHIQYLSRHVPFDGDWWDASDERENWE